MYINTFRYRTRQKEDSENAFELENGARWLEGTSDGTCLCGCGHVPPFCSIPCCWNDRYRCDGDECSGAVS